LKPAWWDAAGEYVLDRAPTSADMIRAAHLDWEVQSQPVFNAELREAYCRMEQLQKKQMESRKGRPNGDKKLATLGDKQRVTKTNEKALAATRVTARA